MGGAPGRWCLVESENAAEAMANLSRDMKSKAFGVLRSSNRPLEAHQSPMRRG